MQVTLIKPWLNHPSGTVIKSVSPGILAELKRLGCVAGPKSIEFAPDVFEAVEKLKKKEKKERAFTGPPANKMIGESPEIKTEDL